MSGAVHTEKQDMNDHVPAHAQYFKSKLRLDDNQTAMLERELRQVSNKTVETQYSVLKSARFIPYSSEIDPGAESWVYRQYDEAGIAKVIANPADDLPLVDILAAEFPQPIITLGAAFSYSVLDLKRAARIA
jgi:hypothetical protein